MKKYNVKKISQDQFQQAFLKLFAEVNPETLKKISEVLKRELSAEKDTEDYNALIISSFLDKSVLPLIQAGQSSLKNGDTLKIDENINNRLYDRKDDRFSNLKTLKDYKKYPFYWKVAADLRNTFILKTNKSDTFESLMDEADGLISKYMSVDEWVKVRSLIKKAEPRLSTSTYQMLEPEFFVGKERDLSQSEIIKHDLTTLNGRAKVDVRQDGHDMLALKEFVSLLKGEKVHPLSIGPGFLAKYMPEFTEAGYHGIVFVIHNDVLKEIKLSKLDVTPMHFGPIMSAQVLTQEVCSIKKQGVFGKLKRYYAEGGLWLNNARYFVVVDGCVSATSNTMKLDYDQLALNDKPVKSGEVFLFEQMAGEAIQTRVYFTPYDYSSLPLIHHHGSVVFGHNDQSLHSCVYEVLRYFSQTDRNDLIDRVTKQGAHKNIDSVERLNTFFKPSFVACLSVVFDSLDDKTILLEPENFHHLLCCIASWYATNDMTMKRFYGYLDGHPHAIETTMRLSANYAPLSHRFVLGEYLEQKSGLVKEEQETTFTQLSKGAEDAFYVNMWHNYQDRQAKKAKRQGSVEDIDKDTEEE